MPVIAWSKRNVARGLILFLCAAPTGAAAQIGTWSIQGVQRVGCQPPLAPCPRRAVGRFRNTITLNEDGTYRVPRDIECPTGALVADEAVGTWRQERPGRLRLSEEGTIEFFSTCFDLALGVDRFRYDIRLTGARRFRGKIRLTGTVSRGSVSSTYREKEDFRGVLLSDIAAATSAESSAERGAGHGASAGFSE